MGDPANLGRRVARGSFVDTQSTDNEIIAGARTGDLRAFEILYYKYQHQVYRTALAILGDAQAAEEVLQDCFMRAHRHLHQLYGEPSISPWLHRVAVNLCYSRLRRNYLSQLTVSLEDLGGYFFPASGPSPEESTYRSEVSSAIQAGIASLGFNYRAVIVMRYLQGFPLAEIAYILNCPVGTVKSRLFHARKMLSKRLASLRGQVAFDLA